ncbi:hypothetical protein DFR52_101236 [Hoeflea marina]|uniref:Autotransporter domain-containing protein n=1 Tax=Hoeflea marina TaxID=274592 RepID=A0A317PS42_9HYPH|nr:hypothetical protein [Hoeflea marina]PWW03555.1 hypothetical protein DFR52_101236 [Hoeflea marina]
MKHNRFAQLLACLSASVCLPVAGTAGEYSINSAQTFEIVAVVPTATGNIVYANASSGLAMTDSDAGWPASFSATSTSSVDASNLVGGVAYSISSGFGVAAANGAWGLAFAAAYGHSAAGFIADGVVSSVSLDSGNAAASVVSGDPVVAAAEYAASGQIDHTVNAVPAVSLSTEQFFKAALSVPAGVGPTISGFELVPGTPAGVYRLRPPISPFAAAADADTPAIIAEIFDTGSFSVDLASGSVPVAASSAFEGRAALELVALSTGGGVVSDIGLGGPALSISTTADNAGGLISLVSALTAASSRISIGTDGASLTTGGNGSHAIVAGLVSQQQAAELAIVLAGDAVDVVTSGDGSWGVVGFSLSGQDTASAIVDISGSDASIATSGEGSGGVTISADGNQGAVAQLVLSGAGASIATGNTGSPGASVVATSPLDGRAAVSLAGSGASLATTGDQSTALLLSANGATAGATLQLSGAGSLVSTLGAQSDAVHAIAHGTEIAEVNVELGGTGSGMSAGGDNSSALVAAAFADQATVGLALSGQGAAISASGLQSAGFIGSANGASRAVASATLSGRMASIRTSQDNSVGVALTAIAAEVDGLAQVQLELTGAGSLIETLGDNSTAATLAGSQARLVVGGETGLFTSGAASHGALILAEASLVDIGSRGTVATGAADAVGLYFLNPLGANTVVNAGAVVAGGGGIFSAGGLDLRNAGVVSSANAAAVELAAGRVWNAGLISGEAGIVRGGGSGPVGIENHGRILANAGPGNVAIELLGGFEDELAVAANGIIVGTIELGAGDDRFVALPGTNLDFLFETAPPESVEAMTGVQVVRPDPNNVVIVDPGYLTGAASQSGLLAARLASGGTGGDSGEPAQGDCGEAVLSGRASGSYGDFDGDGDRAPALTRSYGLITEFAPDSCAGGAASFFIGVEQVRIEGGGSRSLTSSVFAGARYAGETDTGMEYEFLGGIGYLSGDSDRHVLNNRVVSGVEAAEADYSGWMTFAGLRLTGPVMIAETEISPFLQAHAAYGGAFDAQEQGVQTPALFEVGGSYAYDVSAGLSVALQPEAFDAGSLLVSFSGALVIAGHDASALVGMDGSKSVLYSRNSFGSGISLGSGLDVTFDSMPARLQLEGVATAWSGGDFSLEISSNFKYLF